MKESRYISIRETWGPPKPTAPKKNLREEEKEEKQRENKRIKINEKTKNITLTNIRVIENKVIEGEEIRDFEVITTDWDRVFREHEERLEKEVREKKELLDRKAAKENHWELNRECKDFLENNDKN